MVEKVNEAENNEKHYSAFEDVFECNPKLHAYGYKSWDDFFLREFKPGVRPVADPKDGLKIANACESAPLQVARKVKLEDQFWLKDQSYSLKDMIDYGPHQYAKKFANGTVYQAFLSALSFHSWKCPVNGKVLAQYNIPGTYYLQSYYKGFENFTTGKFSKQNADLSAPNDSQPYLSHVAARSVIIIQSDEAALGIVGFVAVGMAECGSCENKVHKDQRIRKGDQLGSFHYGGSTHCLLFQPHVELEFIDYINKHASIDAPRNIAVSSTIATVVQKYE